MIRWVAVLLTAAAVLWAVALATAPFLMTHGVSTVAVLVYEIGSRVCHQRPERSFHLAGLQMPVCARCTGLYASGALGAVAAWAAVLSGFSDMLTRARMVLAAAAAPTVITLAAEWLGLAHPSAGIRALSAAPLGASAGWIFVRALRAEAPSRGRAGEMRYHS